jgi:serine/threonine protein kinase
MKCLSVRQRCHRELTVLKLLAHHPNVVDLVSYYFSGNDDSLQLNLFFKAMPTVRLPK